MGNAISIPAASLSVENASHQTSAVGSKRSFFRRKSAGKQAGSNRGTTNTSTRQVFEHEALPHMDALYNFALRMTREAADADDLVQETFLKAFRFFDKFKPGTNCKAWLFRIMKNSFINRYRKAQKTPETVDYDTVEDFYYSIRSESIDPNDFQDMLYDHLLDDEVTLALESLPEDFRTVVILCDLEGFTYEEIAEFVDCPVGTVRSRLHRGRKLLRDALIEYACRRGFKPSDKYSASVAAQAI